MIGAAHDAVEGVDEPPFQDARGRVHSRTLRTRGCKTGHPPIANPSRAIPSRPGTLTSSPASTLDSPVQFMHYALPGDRRVRRASPAPRFRAASRRPMAFSVPLRCLLLLTTFLGFRSVGAEA